ncbi:MAG: leucine-rich repeat protein, partial [Ruminococcus sp.]|nr:leucine-rich repeat protein [Ruminococcus sp.]
SLIENINIKSPCSFGKNVFADCKNLKTVVFDSDVKVGSEAFSKCNSLSTVEFNGAASVDPRVFRQCTNLTNVDFNGQVDLKSGAFMECTSLENISLDISQKITGNAFDECISLFDINNKSVFDDSTGEFIPEYGDFIRNNFYMAEDIGFINQYAEYQYKKIAAENTDDSMSDIEKVKILHDWVCNHTQYADNINNPEYHTDASILLNDSTVCEGYSKACNLLFNYAGIESYYVHSFDHAWNIVKLGDYYFHVDSTWDDGENISYNHFLKSDDDIRDNGSHSNWDLYKPTSLHSFQKEDKLPECSYSVGDTNMDGALSIADAVKMADFLLGSKSEKAGNIVLYDMNYDGKTDVFDMILMIKELIK